MRWTVLRIREEVFVLVVSSLGRVKLKNILDIWAKEEHILEFDITMNNVKRMEVCEAVH